MAEYIITTEKGKWEVICGLEIHCQIISKSKIFSGASTEFGDDVNENVSYTENGMEGYKHTEHALTDFNFIVASYRTSKGNAVNNGDVLIVLG